MPTPCLLINPHDPDLRIKVDSMKKTPGICIFIDITGSTQMKAAGLKQWIARIHNCFANSEANLSPQFRPIKSIGDSLMYYIEESDLIKSGYTALQIYDGLWQIAMETGADYPEVKIGAAWCEDVYPITFLPESRDYYGIDIDLTARIQAVANSKEVVIDARLHRRVLENYQATGNKDQFESVLLLRGPETKELKGIPSVVTIYRGSNKAKASPAFLTREQLESAADDVFYLAQQMFVHYSWMTRGLPNLADLPTPLHTAIMSNAVAEAQLMYYRKLNEFFRPLNPRHPDDLKCELWGYPATGWFIHPADLDEIHKRVAHPTTRQATHGRVGYEIYDSSHAALSHALPFFAFIAERFYTPGSEKSAQLLGGVKHLVLMWDEWSSMVEISKRKELNLA
jgi:class 3 adenylate cyclase